RRGGAGHGAGGEVQDPDPRRGGREDQDRRGRGRLRGDAPEITRLAFTFQDLRQARGRVFEPSGSEYLTPRARRLALGLERLRVKRPVTAANCTAPPPAPAAAHWPDRSPGSPATGAPPGRSRCRTCYRALSSGRRRP